MSHVVTIDVSITDLDVLKEAIDKLGYQWKANQTTYRWYGVWVNDYHGEDAAYRHNIKTEDYGKCDHAITIPGVDYDIGVIEAPDGSFKLIWDEWKLPKEKVEKLIQTYTATKIKREADQQGIIGLWEEQWTDEGKLIMTITQWE